MAIALAEAGYPLHGWASSSLSCSILGLPFTDVTHVSSMVRAVPGEYWAAAHYVVPPPVLGSSHTD
jgi:hypothetical protein